MLEHHKNPNAGLKQRVRPATALTVAHCRLTIKADWSGYIYARVTAVPASKRRPKLVVDIYLDSTDDILSVVNFLVAHGGTYAQVKQVLSLTELAFNQGQELESRLGPKYVKTRKEIKYESRHSKDARTR